MKCHITTIFGQKGYVTTKQLLGICTTKRFQMFCGSFLHNTNRVTGSLSIFG